MPDWAAGVVTAGTALVAAGVVGLVWRRGNGRMRMVQPTVTIEADTRLLAGLGGEAGVPATLLQFSSAFCAPCRATRRICAEVAEVLDGVRHVEVDAEGNLDAVRALDIRRTPTVLVVDAGGRVVRRASGQPNRAQVIAAVAPLLDNS